MNSAEDYAIFAISLVIPVSIGVFFACRGGKQKTTTEFLLADKNLRSWLVALSLVSSYFSSVGLLGTTAEVFTFGLQYIILIFCVYWMAAAVVHVLMVPMFHRVKVTSVNEVSDLFLKLINFIMTQLASKLITYCGFVFLTAQKTVDRSISLTSIHDPYLRSLK